MVTIIGGRNMSNNDHDTACERHARAENVAAELVTAVYPLYLTHGLRESWLKTELILWKRLTRTMKRWVREPPRELDALRERLLASDATNFLGRSRVSASGDGEPGQPNG
jgi:hypothetical protein